MTTLTAAKAEVVVLTALLLLVRDLPLAEGIDLHGVGVGAGGKLGRSGSGSGGGSRGTRMVAGFVVLGLVLLA